MKRMLHQTLESRTGLHGAGVVTDPDHRCRVRRRLLSCLQRDVRCIQVDVSENRPCRVVVQMRSHNRLLPFGEIGQLPTSSGSD